MAFTNFSTNDEAPLSKTFNDNLNTNFQNPVTDSTNVEVGTSIVVPIDKAIVEVTTGGAATGTLANGVEGQHLWIVLVADGGNLVLTPANGGGYTTITFSDAGDSVHLLYTNSNWYIVGQGGLGTGPLSA